MRILRYGIVGFGNVGAALARHAAERSARVGATHGVDLRLCFVADSRHVITDENGLDALALAAARDAGRRVGDLDAAVPNAGPDVLDRCPLDTLAVTLPTNRATGEPGLAWTRAAVERGRSVVLADKGPALLALPELEACAAEHGVSIEASATVGSALPTLAVARRELAGARIREIHAILNGTTNMILTLMRTRGCPFGDALAEAQRLGIAEPDPSYDVEGWDTAVKLTILARALVDPAVTLERVERTGIDRIPDDVARTASSGEARVRLVGRAVATDGGAVVRVAPEAVPLDDPFFHVEGATKAVRFVTDDFGTLTLIGGASGRTDVAAALLKDILSTVRGNA